MRALNITISELEQFHKMWELLTFLFFIQSECVCIQISTVTNVGFALTFRSRRSPPPFPPTPRTPRVPPYACFVKWLYLTPSQTKLCELSCFISGMNKTLFQGSTASAGYECLHFVEHLGTSTHIPRVQAKCTLHETDMPKIYTLHDFKSKMAKITSFRATHTCEAYREKQLDSKDILIWNRVRVLRSVRPNRQKLHLRVVTQYFSPNKWGVA